MKEYKVACEFKFTTTICTNNNESANSVLQYLHDNLAEQVLDSNMYIYQIDTFDDDYTLISSEKVHIEY